jgi:hypothetical protein
MVLIPIWSPASMAAFTGEFLYQEGGYLSIMKIIGILLIFLLENDQRTSGWVLT